MRSGLASHLKNRLFRGGEHTYRVPCGLYRDINLVLDLRYNFQLYIGMWELETHRYLDRWTDYAWAIDIGAGGGELSLFLLKHKPNIKKIIAIEPDSNEVCRMKQNFQLNSELGVDKVMIVEKRVGAGTEGIELALDDLDIERNSAPGIIKIDVDGHEIDVLRGAGRLLRGHCIDLLVETHLLSLEEQSIKILESYGFTTEVIPNGWYRGLVPEQRTTERSNHNRWLWASNRP